MIGRSGERGSGIFMLAARHDDDDDLYRRQIKSSPFPENAFIELIELVTKSVSFNFNNMMSSSSSSYRAGSTDIPDPLSPLLPIVHRPRQVFRTTICILT